MKYYKQSNNTIIYDNNGSVGRLLAETEKIDIVQLSLDPNAEIDAHALDIDVTFYLISGSAIAVVDGNEISVATGDVVEVKAGSKRGWRNSGNETLELLAIKHK